MSDSQFTDPRDGQTYQIVRMRDGRRWFAENLRFAAPGSLAAPEAYDENLVPYYDQATAGRSYHFRAADLACPPGWHLPTYDEWTNMLAKYGPFETDEWIGNSKLHCDTVELIKSDGFRPIGTAMGQGSFDPKSSSANQASTSFKDGSFICRFWVADLRPGLLHRLRKKPNPAPGIISGSSGEKAEVAFFVCFTDNIYIHAESINFWYSVRCIEN